MWHGCGSGKLEYSPCTWPACGMAAVPGGLGAGSLPSCSPASVWGGWGMVHLPSLVVSWLLCGVGGAWRMPTMLAGEREAPKMAPASSVNSKLE